MSAPRAAAPGDRASRHGGWALLFALFLMAAPARVQAQQSLEYPVKANYLVKFAAYVEWPPRAFASPASPVNVCVVGADPFGSVIDRAAAQGGPSGRPVSVRRLDRIDGRAGCHVAYLGVSPLQTRAQAMAALNGQPVLTVTDTDRRGPRGMIHFAISGNRVRFHIDDRAAQQRGLSISSRLLALALSVRPRMRS